MTMTKVAVITNTIPDYRQPFYELLLQQERHYRVTVFFQSSLPGVGIKLAHPQLSDRFVEVPFWGLSGERLTWQRLPVLRLWREFDIYVFYGNPRVLSNVVWASLYRLLGKRVVIWGQAHTAGADPVTERLRLLWWHLFDHFLVYTDKEAQQLKAHGFRRKTVTGMNNGLDQERIERAARAWPAGRLSLWEARQGIAGKAVLLSCARLEAKNRFDLIIESLPVLLRDHPDILWGAIGDGPLREQLAQQATKLGVDHCIRWLGSIYDEEELAPWFLSSRVLVHPGAIGLSLMHAFGYGLPVISHDNPMNQMPEFAALEHGVNGLLFQEESISSFSQVVTSALENEGLRRTLGSNALRHVREHSNTKIMTHRFFQGMDNASSNNWQESH